MQKVPKEGQRLGAWWEVATCLWMALGQEKQESCEESQEEEDAERHGPSLTAFQSMTVST